MKTVLVIEDNPGVRTTLSRWLNLEGLHPLTAENGAVGLTVARQRTPDLILCDARMPVMDGIETLRALRNDSQIAGIPCFLMTSEVDMDHFFVALSLGVRGFVRKPISLKELRQALHSETWSHPNPKL